MIAVDWGTTNFRAFRLDGTTVVARIPEGPGILAVSPDSFPAVLEAAIHPWLDDGERRIVMSGMVGSRQGWIEAPYLPCPADPAALAAAAVRVPFAGAELRLIPGLVATDPFGTPEVMRGEEVQVAGVLDRTGADALVCLPGSHSKWVRLVEGRIDGFTTYLTGEVFAAMRHHTILGRLIQDAPVDTAAFTDGVDRAAQPGGLLHHLFGVRTLGLFDRLTPKQAASFLSGLLIGHEVRAVAPSVLVHLVGASSLCPLYAVAIAHAGGSALILDEDAAATGLGRLAEHIEWT
jgi:2-dehydro-3-deoxygalactonokinase